MALPRLQEKAPARVRLGSEGSASLSGHVDRIGREVDRQTHELLVDVLLTAPPARIAIGQRADAWIEIDRHADVVKLPFAFVQRAGSDVFAYVDRDGRIERRPIRIGAEGVAEVEVVSGLSAGDTALTAPSPGTLLAEGRRWALAARSL